MTIFAIAEKLANALRNRRCTCITAGSWPLFHADAKAHKARVCQRCAVIDEFELFVSKERK